MLNKVLYACAGGEHSSLPRSSPVSLSHSVSDEPADAHTHTCARYTHPHTRTYIHTSSRTHTFTPTHTHTQVHARALGRALDYHSQSLCIYVEDT